MLKREQRRRVMLPVLMRSDAGWSEAVVRDISRRGMLISSSLPFRRGTYVEVRRAEHIIVARIMWSVGGRAGARTQDPIDVDRLIGVATGAPGSQGHGEGPDLPERGLAERAGQSRDRSARLQFVALASAGALAALLLAEQVGASLAVPLHAIRVALAGDT